MLRRPDDIRTDRAREVLAGASASGDGGWLGATVVRDLLSAYGLPMLPLAMCATHDEAIAAAQRVGYPVALKTAAEGVVHKSDVGGVSLGLVDEADVRTAFQSMVDRLGGEAIVQPMAKGTVELVAGLVRQDTFGPVAMVGLGGVWTDVLADRVFGLLPLSDLEASALLRSLHCHPLLAGHRGSPPVDLAAVEDLLMRLSALADDMPQVAELDLNPVLAGPDGVVVVDARVRLADPAEVPDEFGRHLRR